MHAHAHTNIYAYNWIPSRPTSLRKARPRFSLFDVVKTRHFSSRPRAPRGVTRARAREPFLADIARTLQQRTWRELDSRSSRGTYSLKLRESKAIPRARHVTGEILTCKNDYARRIQPDIGPKSAKECNSCAPPSRMSPRSRKIDGRYPRTISHAICGRSLPLRPRSRRSHVPRVPSRHVLLCTPLKKKRKRKREKNRRSISRRTVLASPHRVSVRFSASC